jgi:hypothetical protein
MNNIGEERIPSKIFIVPYRNRIQHKFFFMKYMSFILEDKNDYEIYFSHQCDDRTFNRGATKNIGFIAMKEKYPFHYKDITFIFNDVDTLPFHKIFDYETEKGVVKHYYGFKYALGGIVVIKGEDFERINGYPCYWGWGMEDNVLQKRCEKHGLTIDRSIFYEIGSPEILQLFDGVSRIVTKKDSQRGEYDVGLDGITSINKICYNINDKSNETNDNIFTIDNPNIYFINITEFEPLIPFGTDGYYNYDLRNPNQAFGSANNPLKEAKNFVTSTKDWKNIPYVPTALEHLENIAKQLVATGKQVPQNLLKKIQEEKYKNFKDDYVSSRSSVSPGPIAKNAPLPPNIPSRVNSNPSFNPNSNPNSNPTYNPSGPPNSTENPHIPVPNKYSPQYAQYIGAKPRASASVRIRLGGAY